MQPILKWAGGKRQLLPHLRPLFNPSRRYIEPFLGGGALLFALQPDAAVVNDSNKELIETYRAIASDPSGIYQELQKHENSKEYFLDLRAKNPWDMAPQALAARMIFLNKTCFNGLYRVNRQNKFNVPFGNYKKPSLPSLSEIKEAGEYLKKVKLCSEDFRDFILREVRPGDQVFLDPPYVPVSEYSDFTRYTPGRFNMEDQEELAEIATELVKRGALVVATNSDTEIVRELYSGFDIHQVAARRSINKDSRRRQSTELIMIRGTV